MNKKKLYTVILGSLCLSPLRSCFQVYPLVWLKSIVIKNLYSFGRSYINNEKTSGQPKPRDSVKKLTWSLKKKKIVKITKDKERIGSY